MTTQFPNTKRHPGALSNRMTLLILANQIRAEIAPTIKAQRDADEWITRGDNWERGTFGTPLATYSQGTIDGTDLASENEPIMAVVAAIGDADRDSKA